MDIRATSLCLLSVFTLAVAGCSSNGKAPEEDPNVFPASYKDEILNTLTNLLEDPTNVRNAYISDPVLRAVGKDQRYTVCVRSDSRNANKEYMGSKDPGSVRVSMVFNSGFSGNPRRCLSAISAAAFCICTNRTGVTG